jgi:hypothetical protein
MKHETRLLFIVAMIALVFPLVLTVGSAQAANYPSAGLNIMSNGQWEVTDPGYCTDGAGDTVTKATATAGTSATCEEYTDYTDAAGCNGSLLSQCTDGGAAAGCTTRGYKLVKSRSWTSHDGNVTTSCFATFTNEKTYGTGVWARTDGYNLDDVSYEGCLHCHSTNYMDVRGFDHNTAMKDPAKYHPDGSYYRAMDQSFPRSGHKNVFRKVVPGNPMGGPLFTSGKSGTNPYTTVDWSNGLDAATETNSIYYIYNSYFSNVKQAQLNRMPMSDPTTVSSISNSASVRTCFYCHNGGFNLADTASEIWPTEFDPAAGGKANKWAFNGIECFACHGFLNNPDFESHHTGIDLENPTISTQVCARCHRAEQTVAAEDATAPLVVEEIANHHAGFAGEFLNSPHARYSGSLLTLAEITDDSKYDTHFTNEEGHNRGCTGCHEVHYSSIDTRVMDLTDTTHFSIKPSGTCGVSCHPLGVSAGFPNFGVPLIAHPCGTAQTPLTVCLADGPNTKQVMNACVTCHMGGGLTQHYFRINTDPSYSMYVESDEGNEVKTYDEDGYAATGMDLEHVCGQCHDNAAKEAAGVRQIAMADLVQVAEAIHTGVVPGNEPQPELPPLPGNHVDAHAGTTSGVCNEATGLCTASPVYGAPGDVFTLTDASTADESAGPAVVYIDWDDGTPISQTADGETNGGLNGVFSHSYMWPGTYHVVHGVRDTWGFVNEEVFEVIVQTGTGKGLLKISATGDFGLDVNSNPLGMTYKVWTSDGSTIVTSGVLVPTNSVLTNFKDITLDAGIYLLEILSPPIDSNLIGGGATNIWYSCSWAPGPDATDITDTHSKITFGDGSTTLNVTAGGEVDVVGTGCADNN